MPRPLTFTPRRQQVYDFIVAFKQDHDGVAPSVAEIRKACGISSNSVVIDSLNGLERLGMIECDYGSGRSRMITVCGGRWTPPSRTLPKVSPVKRAARVPAGSLVTE
jgi:SOS-response transcriptional repressor LexA